MQKEARLSNIVLAVTSAIGLLLLVLPSTSVVATFKAIVTYSMHPIPAESMRALEWAKDIPSNMMELLATDQENRRLKTEYQELTLIKAKNAELEAENDRLRGLLGLEPPPGYSYKWASVLSRDPIHWYRSLVIDKGKDDGVEVNAPVVALSSGTVGVVGHVAEVGPSTAKVLLLTDDLSSIAVAVEGQIPALVEGIGGPMVRLNYVSERVELSTGTEVVTADISPTFPPGLPVGRIVEKNPQDLYLSFQSAKVEPAVDLARIHEVMVLQRKERANRNVAEVRVAAVEAPIKKSLIEKLKAKLKGSHQEQAKTEPSSGGAERRHLPPQAGEGTTVSDSSNAVVNPNSVVASTPTVSDMTVSSSTAKVGNP